MWFSSIINSLLKTYKKQKCLKLILLSVKGEKSEERKNCNVSLLKLIYLMDTLVLMFIIKV